MDFNEILLVAVMTTDSGLKAGAERLVMCCLDQGGSHRDGEKGPNSGYVEGESNRAFQIIQIQSMRKQGIKDDSKNESKESRMTPGNPQVLGLCSHEACHGLSPSGLGAPQGDVGLAYCLASRVFDK